MSGLFLGNTCLRPGVAKNKTQKKTLHLNQKGNNVLPTKTKYTETCTIGRPLKNTKVPKFDPQKITTVIEILERLIGGHSPSPPPQKKHMCAYALGAVSKTT